MNYFISIFRDRKAKQGAIWIALFLMLFGLLFVFQNGKTSGKNYVEQKRMWEVLSKEKQTIHLHWLRTLNPLVRNTEGDLIWNTDQQKGFMHFINLPRLKGGQFYHLWIYDLNKSSQHPVLAGIFSGLKEGGNELYVSVEPEQEISLPFKFLLTIGNKGSKDFSKSQSLLLAQP